MNRRLVVGAAIGLVVLLIFVFALGRNKNSVREKTLNSIQPAALYKEAQELQSQDKLVEAVKLYKEIISKAPNFKEIAAVERSLWDLNIKLLFSPIITEQDISYKVAPGDTLGKIAANFNTTVELIKRSNKLSSNLIRPGQRLKIAAVKFSIIVDKSQNSLTLKTGDEIFKVYNVATGKFNKTPVGNFTIVEKLTNPDWYKPGEGIILASDPRNILGSRWLGLSEPQYGIHGGATAETLGNQVTDGCIRMTNPEVEELFSILPRGTEVTIVD
ncbi:MAG: L,D-transpeptidase family protein [Candidatus Omnitrophica bacterium]|nr:L,D-transpeptidase family protein [Candidatus Omnitrophota bacterium]